MSLTVTLDPKTGKKIVYRDAQAGVSAVPNLIPPIQDSSYQRYTGFLVTDGEEKELPPEESMYICEKASLSSSDSSDEDDEEDDEEDENPYTEEATVYFWDGKEKQPINSGYFKKDDGGDKCIKTICISDEDIFSKVGDEDLFDKVEWGNFMLPWMDEFERKETMMLYECRSKNSKYKYIYVQKDYEDNDDFEAFTADGENVNYCALFDDGEILVTEDKCALYKLGNLPQDFDESKYKNDDATYDFNWYNLVDGDESSSIVVRR